MSRQKIVCDLILNKKEMCAGPQKEFISPTYLPQVNNFMNLTAEKWSHFHLIEMLTGVGWCFKFCKTEVDHSSQTMQRVLANGTDDLAEVWSMKFDACFINIIEKYAIRAFVSGWYPNQTIGCRPVVIAHSDLQVVSVISFVQTVRDSQQVG